MNEKFVKYAVINPYICHGEGLGWIFVVVLNIAAYAIQRGFVPVIDMQHNDNQYFKDGRKFKDNSWEYYFKQPCGVNLEDIKQVENNSQIKVVTHQRFKYGDEIIPIFCGWTKQRIDDFPYKAICKQYFDLSDSAKQYIHENYKKNIGDETEILGILCRGTDYINKRPKWHAIPATPKQLIEEAKKLKEKYNFKKIYVATEDLQIYNEFKEAFGDMMLPNTQYMYERNSENSDKYLSEFAVDRPNHHYRLGMEYLLSMYILSQCKYFVVSNSCSGVALVAAFSDFCKNMKYVKIWNCGNYGVVKKVKYSNSLQRIFSIKNEQSENIIRKVITICGLKLKVSKRYVNE